MGAKADAISKKLSKADSKVFKKLQDLGKVKDRFVIPEKKPEKKIVEEAKVEPPRVIAKVEEADQFKEESEQIVKRDEKTLSLINVAVHHITVYDSKETALQIVNQAYNYCPSVFNKRKISNAAQSLKAAIKAEKWANSRKRKRHVDQDTVKKNIATFLEKLADTVVSIKVELEKRTQTLFKRIKDEYKTELPISLPATKNYTVKRAHVVVQAVTKPTGKALYLEGQLYLIENAKVVGINSNTIKNPLKKATEVALKLGSSIYEARLGRPADNIHWYLVSSFGAKVNFASFTDALALEDDSSSGFQSYNEYVKGAEANRRVGIKLKTQRLAALRRQFKEDNTTVSQDIRYLQIELDNLVHEKQILKDRFASLTMLSDTDRGLSPASIKLLDRNMKVYRENLILREALTYSQANLRMIRQRVEARTAYISIMEITEKIRAKKRHIAFLEHDMAVRRGQFADSLGLINVNKYVSNDLED